MYTEPFRLLFQESKVCLERTENILLLKVDFLQYVFRFLVRMVSEILNGVYFSLFWTWETEKINTYVLILRYRGLLSLPWDVIKLKTHISKNFVLYSEILCESMRSTLFEETRRNGDQIFTFK